MIVYLDWFNRNPFLLVLALVALLLLTGCNTAKEQLTGASRTAVCKALIGPIKYNSQKVDSQRFAAAKLAPDLATRNRVGQELGCPQYKR